MSLARPLFRSEYANARQLSVLESLVRNTVATRTGKLGAPAAVAANQPRFEFDPLSLACNGLLLEPSATNLLPYSQCHTGWSPAGTAPPAVTNDVTYRGESCASILFGADSVAGFAGSRASRSAAYMTASITSGVAYSWVARVALSRALTGAESIVVSVTGASGIGNSYIAAGSGAAGKFETIRPSAPVVSLATGSVYPAVYAGSALTAPLTVYINCVQVEQGVPTSYVPSGAAPAVRAADVLSVAPADFARIWRPDEGTLVVRGVAGVSSGGTQIAAYANDGGNSNRLMLYRASAAGGMRAVVSAGGVNLVDVAIAGALADGAPFAAALSYKSGQYLAAINGVAVQLSAATQVPAVTQLHIGHGFGASQWGGCIGSVATHGRAATLAELVEATR